MKRHAGNCGLGVGDGAARNRHRYRSARIRRAHLDVLYHLLLNFKLIRYPEFSKNFRDNQRRYCEMACKAERVLAIAGLEAEGCDFPGLGPHSLPRANITGVIAVTFAYFCI
jgi:hypothetical protein